MQRVPRGRAGRRFKRPGRLGTHLTTTWCEDASRHPRFQELFAAVSDTAQQQRVGAALSGLLGAEVAA